MTDDRFHWCTEDRLAEIDSARAIESLGWDADAERLPCREEARPEIELFLKMRESDETVVFQIEERDGTDGAWINAAKPIDLEQ